MSKGLTNRRDMMKAAVGAGLGTLVHPALAQDSHEGAGWPERAEEIHRRVVARLREVLGADQPGSKEGLHKLVDFLKKLGLIDDADAKLLYELVDAISDFSDLDKLEKQLAEMLDRAKAKAKDLTTTLVSVALSSVRFVKKEVSDHKRAIFIISGDVSGALLGACTCMALGPWVAAAAALSGGVAGSCTAWYGSR